MDSKDRKKLEKELVEWIEQWPFTRFVSLQFNDFRNSRLPEVNKLHHVRRALRSFDATVNHALLKRHWAKHPDRIFAVWVPEKLSVSPHWHGLVRFFAETEDRRSELEAKFDSVAVQHWKRVAPAGTCDVKAVYGLKGATEYLAKSVPYGVSYEHMVVPDEFQRG